MTENEIPYALQLPILIGGLKATVYVHEKSYVLGEECRSLPHNHGDYELRYICQGKGNQIVEYETIRTESGDILLIHPQEFHYQTMDSATQDLEQFSFRFSIKPPTEAATAVVQRTYVSLTAFLDEFRMARDTDRVLIPLLQMVQNELKAKESGFFACLQALFVIILTTFLRLVSDNPQGILPSEEQKYSGNLRNQIDHFFRYHYMHDVKLQDLADAIKVSTRQASRVLMREFGETYVKHLMKTRIQQAKFFLVHGENDIHKIGTDCGFQSYNYFATCFKQVTGYTPTEYRRLYQDGKFD